MCSDDFRLVAEDETRVAEIADAAITALHAAPAAPPEGCVYVSQELLADYNAMKRAQSTSDTTARERMAREMPWLKNYHQMPRGGANSAALCAAAPACQKCDGTGDVHRADGEWLGRCSCAAPPAPVGGADFSAFAKQQGYDLTTCAYHGSITTADGVGPATYWNDDTEHAWRGWANKPSAPVLSEDGSEPVAWLSPEVAGACFYVTDRALAEHYGYTRAVYDDAPAPSASPAALTVPDGFALVPLRMTPEMLEIVSDEEGWEWADLLNVAGAITEDQHSALLDASPAAPQPSAKALTDAIRTAGTKLANAAFNLAQRAGDTLSDEWAQSLNDLRREWDAAILPAEAPAGAQHPDDTAVDRFAAAMKAKMAASRAKGRGGWDDRHACTNEYLARLLVDHVQKGDPVDVANFAMMIQQRDAVGIEFGYIAGPRQGSSHLTWAFNEHIRALLAAEPPCEDKRNAERYRWLRDKWGYLEDEYDGDGPLMTRIWKAEPSHGWDVDPSSLDAAIDSAIAKGEGHD